MALVERLTKDMVVVRLPEEVPEGSHSLSYYEIYYPNFYWFYANSWAK